MMYFEHSAALPYSVILPLILTVVISAVGVIAYCINLLYKKHIKCRPTKHSFFNNKFTKKLCFGKQEDVDVLFSASDAARFSKAQILYFVILSICIISLLYSTFDYYPSRYKTTQAVAIEDFAVLKEQISKRAQSESYSFNFEETFEDNEFYIERYELCTADGEHNSSLMLCFDKIDKMKKMSISYMCKNDVSLNSLSTAQTQLFSKICSDIFLESFSEQDIDSFKKELLNDDCYNYSIDDREIYQYTNTNDNFTKIYIINYESERELVFSGVIFE